MCAAGTICGYAVLVEILVLVRLPLCAAIGPSGTCTGRDWGSLAGAVIDRELSVPGGCAVLARLAEQKADLLEALGESVFARHGCAGPIGVLEKCAGSEGRNRGGFE